MSESTKTRFLALPVRNPQQQQQEHCKVSSEPFMLTMWLINAGPSALGFVLQLAVFRLIAVSVQVTGSHVHPQNLTSFAVCLFPVAQGVLLVQKQ